MSKKAAKRARQEAEKQGQLRQDAITNGNNSSFMKNLLRANKKTLGFALLGTVAVASTLWILEQLPSWTGARKDYDLTIAFLNHDKMSDGVKFTTEISDRIQKGENIKVVFVEAANMNETNYESFALSLNDNLAMGKSIYRSMLAGGMNQARADQESLSRMALTSEGLEAGFMGQLYLTALKYNLTVMPIEGHTTAELAEVKSAMDFIDVTTHRWDTLVESNAGLHDLMLNQMQISEGLTKINGGIQATRNREIAENLERRFEQTEKLFPQLEHQKQKNHQLKAIAFLGLNHADVVQKFNPSGPKLSIESETYDETATNSIDSICARLKINEADPGGKMSEKVAYLAAIDRRWFADGMAMLDRIGRHDLVEMGISNALNMTTQQLEELDRQSSEISNPNIRLNFVLNRILGMDIFKLPP